MNINKFIIALPLIYSPCVFSDENNYIIKNESLYVSDDETPYTQPSQHPFETIEVNSIMTSPSSFDKKISDYYIKIENNKILLTDEIIQHLGKYVGEIKTNDGKYITKENIIENDIINISPEDKEIRKKLNYFFFDEINNIPKPSGKINISFNKKAIQQFLAEYVNQDIEIGRTRDPALTVEHYHDIVDREKNNAINQGDLFSIENEFNNKIITLIKKSNVELSKFDNQIKFNEAMTHANQSGHAMNLDKILTNEKDIKTNKDNIEVNKEGMITNKEHININKNDIEANKEDIIINKKNINTNKDNIEINKESIKINKEDINNITENYINNLNINGTNTSLKDHFATLYTEQSISRTEFKTLKNDFEYFKSDTQNRFYKVEKQANQGIASVAAMSNLPFTNTATFSTAIGIGNYRNATALAWGMQYRINENIKVRASTAWNDSNNFVSAGGVGISW